MGNSRDLRSDGGDAPRIDRPILEDIRDRLQTASQFESVAIVSSEGETRLEAVLDPASNPPSLRGRVLDVRWYTNDDFRIHYQEDWAEEPWQQRWDRHPSAHNSRDHFHPPPAAATPGNDRTWPTDYREMMAHVITAVGERDEEIWSDVATNG